MAVVGTLGRTAVKVIEQDRGFNRAVRGLELLKGREIHIGFWDGPVEENGTAVVDIAAYNEFGTRSIPSRPFMQMTSDIYKDETMKQAEAMVGRVIDGNLTVDVLLKTLGEFYSNKMKLTIRQAKTWAVPNAAATIARKGSTSPLIDTGRMLNSVTYEIT